MAAPLDRMFEDGGVMDAALSAIGARTRPVGTPDASRVDVALNLIDQARRDANVPGLTALQRHFLHQVLAAPDVINHGLREAGMFYGGPMPDDHLGAGQPEPMTVAEKIAELVADDGPLACEARDRVPEGTNHGCEGTP